MKCKGVKNVENGSAARKSSDRTDKPTNDDEEVDIHGIDLDTIELELI